MPSGQQLGGQEACKSWHSSTGQAQVRTAARLDGQSSALSRPSGQLSFLPIAIPRGITPEKSCNCSFADAEKDHTSEVKDAASPRRVDTLQSNSLAISGDSDYGAACIPACKPWVSAHRSLPSHDGPEAAWLLPYCGRSLARSTDPFSY